MSTVHLQGLTLAHAGAAAPLFENFSATIHPGQRIAIVGDNGSGKSTLLRLLAGEIAPSSGRLQRPSDWHSAYLPQQLDEPAGLSGGERVLQRLRMLLAEAPDALLLDEPGNHLDATHRRWLLRELAYFPGTLLMVTHDLALSEALCDTVWALQPGGALRVFHGAWSDLLAEEALQRERLARQLDDLQRQREQTHQALMQSQRRAAQAREHGARSIEQRKWATIRSATKLGRGNSHGADQQAQLRAQRAAVLDELAALPRHEPLQPRFHLQPGSVRQGRALLQISQGSLAWAGTTPLFDDLALSLMPGERLALVGENGSGKSSLALALATTLPPGLQRGGSWTLPTSVARLDQQGQDLTPEATVLEQLSRCAPDWPLQQRRHHLAGFLFREQAAVERPVRLLSGGERMRLSLACLAASAPALLILDEPSNHLDHRTRQHLIEVLRGYPGALLLISHDEALLSRLGITQRLQLRRGGLAPAVNLPPGGG
ncbi:ATP-binding cassette domain-containing protein [Paucibacter sp. APW11]|uniref:ATP-binding cassette domain-containing protein n=1 Tax=Roseateles aquae TaxID=3077235 RepID=A0ABU3PEN0_9BURK|nr:ATP-binding cassette domain-containing protein [Paucibacter sp. APW11]MDT9001052.1 ATP-binding cassette domain-containing protein [Paucibacter sp. APW11]